MVDTNSFSDEQAALQPTSLLEMAQRVHDDFVATGKAKADTLVSDAQLKHDELISSAKEFHDITILEAESEAATIIEDAQLSAFTLISDAKIKSDSIINGIQDKKLQLEAAILKLQEFESTYRANLTALVSGAQATLAVAELAAEDTKLAEPEEKDTSAVAGVNFEEVIDRAVHTDADPGHVGTVRDGETSADFGSDQTETESGDASTDEANTVDENISYQNEHLRGVMTQMEVVKTSQGEKINSEALANDLNEDPLSEAEDEAPSDDVSALDDEEVSKVDEDEDESIDSDEAPSTIEETSSNENESPVYYDPLATKPAIDASTVASILGQSGLDTSDEKPATFITGRPGWGKTTPIVQVPVDEKDSDVEAKEEK